MAIEKKLDLTFEEISRQLGVSSVDLKNFIELHQGNEYFNNSSLQQETLALFVIEEYHNNLKELFQINKRSSETWKTYNNFLKRIKNYLNDVSPNLKISEMNEIILYKIIQHPNKNEKKYAAKTINKYNSILKSIMKFAYEMNYTRNNLSNRFTILNTALVPKYIKDVDIENILKLVENFPKSYRCRAMIIFLLGTGCRVSEISNLKLRDFDIENEIIIIRNGKGNKDRIIPMFNLVKSEMLTYLKKSGMDKWDSNCNGYLFARDENQERIRNFPIRTIEYLIERIRIKLPELQNITVHTFRHTFAVRCLKIGIGVHNLALILGHTDPKTTMIYTQLYNEDLKEQITKKFPFPFENLLNQVIIKEVKD